MKLIVTNRQMSHVHQSRQSFWQGSRKRVLVEIEFVQHGQAVNIIGQTSAQMTLRQVQGRQFGEFVQVGWELRVEFVFR